jgi:rifampicin phosphotransferase
MVTTELAEPALFDPGLILRLEAADGSMIDRVGGKAANLGELIGAGLPVPSGFCVTTAAYRLVTAGTDLGQVCAALAATSPSDTSALTSHARRAREILAAAPMPSEVADAVTAAYDVLCRGAGLAVRLSDAPGSGEAVPVAVRSSATAEDLPTASFAGQQDTFLNVIGTPAVLDAVHRCWVSLWTDRAVSYRAVNGIDHATVELAVVIQRMVDAAVAGVLFTADPVTGRRHHAVIDSSPGLGEAVVSGAVNPDRFVVDSQTGRIIERRLGDKRLIVRAVPGGGTEHVSVGPAEGMASLEDTQLLRLVSLGQQVERHYGSPQDIEWALDEENTAWLTQARPITTLFPLPPAAGTDDGSQLRVYFCFSLAQGLQRPITPMGLSAFRVLASGVSQVAGVRVPDPVAGPTTVTEAAGRLFLDVTALIRHPVGRVAFPRVLDVMEARSAVVIRQLLEGDPRLSRLPGGRALFARRLARVAIRYRVPLVVIQAVARPDAVHRRCAVLEADLERAARLLDDGATGGERLDAVTRLLKDDVVPALPRIAPAAAAGFALLGLAGRLLGDKAHPGDLQAVLRGIPHNITTEMDLSLWGLASRIRADTSASATVRDSDVADLTARYRAGTLPAAAQHGLEAFLGRYGHRAVAEIDIGIPRWREDPSHLLGVLANYLRLPKDAADPNNEFQRGAREAETMIDKLQHRAAGRARMGGRARAAAVGFCLVRARQLAGLREMPKYLMVLAVAGARAQLTVIGKELASAGRVAEAEDVFFLDFTEVRAALDGVDQRALVRRRRQMYDREMGRRHLPRLLLSDGTEPEAATAPAADGALHGTPASAGTVTAPARVVFDPAGAHLAPGEILVVPSTDPGWTPLFLTAGGLVMEMGGANSHGAVVAREYGIPAVVGVPDATSRITTGQRVTLDGTSGFVVPAQDQDPGPSQ